ncbi:MAG TPA: hypothetical protein V6D00_10925 [Pantanalinema sp.]
MGVDGIFNHQPSQPDQRREIGDPRRDPRFSSGRDPGGFAFQKAAPEAQATPAPALGDDRLQLTQETPDNPFQALINHRQRRRRRKHDGDASLLDG